MILAVLTREDALILVPVAAIYWAYRRSDRWYLYAAMATIMVFAVVRALSIAHVGMRPYYVELIQVGYNLKAFTYLLRTGNVLHPITSLFTTFFPLGAIALWGIRNLPDFLKASVLSFALYIIFAFGIARLQEADHWYLVLPLFVIPAIYILLPQLHVDQHSEPA